MKKAAGENLISYQDAAQMRGVSKQAIKSLVKHGRLPAEKINGVNYLRREDITNFVDRRQVKEVDVAARSSDKL